MKTFVVIPHRILTDKVQDLAERALDSFRNTSDATIISVNDAGTQGAEMIRKKSDVYLWNKENKGFAATCNKGFNWVLKHWKDDCYVVCANNDIEVFPHWLDHFGGILDAFGGDMIGGLGYKDRNVEGYDITEYEKNPGSKFYMPCISEGGRFEDWMFPGGFWMMKKNILTEVGLLDERFLHGGYEDIDLFWRAKQAGKRLLMTPKVAYWHYEGATRFSEEERGHQGDVEPANRAYFHAKHGFDAHTRMNEILVDNRINF